MISLSAMGRKEYEIKANEAFFEQVFELLHDGGKWGWIDEQINFTKSGEHLIAPNKEAYEKVARIVSAEYLNKRFTIWKENH